MVANHLNSNISFFLALMHSPYIGDTNIINGHAIYNSLLRWTDIKPDKIEKVSFGISQNEPIPLEGSNKFYTKIDERPKIKESKSTKISKSVLDNLIKGYDAFKVLRGIENSLTSPVIDNSPIPFEICTPKHGAIVIHKIDYFTFYIIWKGSIPEIDFTDTEFTLGAGRNNGFGFSRIEQIYNTTTDNLLIGIPENEKFSAINGINGIYNHSRYGFGEYIIDTSIKSTKKLIKFTTPLCMRSTYPEATQYGTLPTFVNPINYEKINYYIWSKGKKHTLECIQSGKVFELVNT